MSAPRVVVFDYGSGNIHSALKALESVGARVSLSADRQEATDADGLVVPGVGAFASVVRALRASHGEEIIERRLAGGRPVLGICVGMQVLFDRGVENGVQSEGLGQWPGTVSRLDAEVVPHMGWNTVDAPESSTLFSGIGTERFYFVHSYAALRWEAPASGLPGQEPLITWSRHDGPFVAAVENGPLSATQFHPEKSGQAGLRLLTNWLGTL